MNHDKWSTTNTTNEDTMQVNFTHDDLLNDTQKILELSIANRRLGLEALQLSDIERVWHLELPMVFRGPKILGGPKDL